MKRHVPRAMELDGNVAISTVNGPTEMTLTGSNLVNASYPLIPEEDLVTSWTLRPTSGGGAVRNATFRQRPELPNEGMGIVRGIYLQPLLGNDPPWSILTSQHCIAKPSVMLPHFQFLLLVLATFPFVTCTAIHQRWQGGRQWVDLWTLMPQLTESANLPAAPFNTSVGVFQNATIRQTLQMAIPADTLRIRISNAFGDTPLSINRMTIAIPGPNATSAGSPLIQTDSVQTVTFSQVDGITIPHMALAVSDPIQFSVKPGDSISVTMYLDAGQAGWNITSHPGSRVNSWFGFGDQTSAQNLTGATQTVAHWYFLSAVEGWLTDDNSAFAIVGDSITDGRGSTTNANNRWPNLLNERMQKDGYAKRVAPVNQAAGGNRILADGLGPNAWSRIPRDVLSQSGIKYAMIFEGVNDIGTAANTTAAQAAVYDQLIAAYQQIITQVHSFGIPMFAATITPFSAPNSTIQPYSDPTREATRVKVNDWIKNSGRFDYVVDFAGVVADPNQPDQLNPMFNSGDFLHPSVAGYEMMAEAFDIGVFARCAGGVSSYQ